MDEQLNEAVEEVKQPEVAEEVIAQNTLNSLIISLHSILDQARDIVVKHNQKMTALDEKHKSISNREVSVNDQANSLKEREAAVAKVENIQKLYQEATALMDSANSRINAASEAERALATRKSEHESKVAEDAKQTQLEANNVLKQRKAIDQEVTKRVNEFLVANGYKQE